MLRVHSSPTTFAALALVITAGCATVSHDAVSPVDVHRREEVRLVVEPQSAGLADAEYHADPVAPGTPMSTLRLELYFADVDAIEDALGDRSGSLTGVVCSRAEADRLCDELTRAGAERPLDLPRASTLQLFDGQRGSIAVMNQTAYVAGFEVVQHDDQAIADPRIDVAQDGVLLTAVMRGVASGAHSIDLELTVCELERPFEERTIELFHRSVPVTVQLPRAILRRLSLASQLAPDEALVFGGAALHSTRDGKALIAVLEVDDAEQPPPDAH
jgi:hypothetical protein